MKNVPSAFWFLCFFFAIIIAPFAKMAIDKIYFIGHVNDATEWKACENNKLYRYPLPHGWLLVINDSYVIRTPLYIPDEKHTWKCKP